MTISSELKNAGETIELLARLVRSQIVKPEVEFERLLDGYVEARRLLAKQFCKVAQSYLLRGDNLLETTRKRIEERMIATLDGRVPREYLAVHGYKSVHAALLEYLVQHLGNYVRSSKLRILTADQVHTERRVRELRDLGFAVEWNKVSDEDQYILRSPDPDIIRAVKFQVQKNVKNDKLLGRSERENLLAILAQSE